MQVTIVPVSEPGEVGQLAPTVMPDTVWTAVPMMPSAVSTYVTSTS